mgnify:CR=1 FL=1
MEIIFPIFGPSGRLAHHLFENPQFGHSPGFHFVGSTPDPRNPVGSKSVAEPIESSELSVFVKTRISILAKASPPRLGKAPSETWKLSIRPNICCPATLKRTQCSGRQHQSVQFDWQAQWIREIDNDPPLGVVKFPYKLQHMDTSRA